MGGLQRAKEIGLGQNLFGMVAKGRIRGWGGGDNPPSPKTANKRRGPFHLFRGKADMTYEIR